MRKILDFFLGEWTWLLPLATAAIAVTWAGLEHIALVSERAARAADRQQAAELRATKEAEARQKDNENARLARDLDTLRAQADAAIAAGRADFDRRLADVLRARRQACSDRMPVAAAPAIADAGTAAGSDAGPRALAAGSRLRAMIKSLQADVQLCWAFGAKTGR